MDQQRIKLELVLLFSPLIGIWVFSMDPPNKILFYVGMEHSSCWIKIAIISSRCGIAMDPTPKGRSSLFGFSYSSPSVLHQRKFELKMGLLNLIQIPCHHVLANEICLNLKYRIGLKQIFNINLGIGIIKKPIFLFVFSTYLPVFLLKFRSGELFGCRIKLRIQ